MNSFGRIFRVSIFGESHGDGIGAVVDGVPSGMELSREDFESDIRRRAPGAKGTTPRKEADEIEILSGVYNGRTTGAPLAFIFRNQNTRSGDYSQFEATPRPGHADYVAQVKWEGANDPRGGGHFSGRLTAPLCIVGGLCKQLLAQEGITVISRIAEIAGICDNGELLASTAEKPFPVVDDAAGEAMQKAILAAKAEGDSVGGVIECAILGAPAGLGDPMFGGMENRISQLVFGIPAVKGISFGAGFDAARLRGSENNDPFTMCDGKVVTRTNNCGGILGGITNGMPIVFRAAVKPTPSIGIEQDTVNLSTGENAKLTVVGRHDPCIVPRAVPCVEAAAAIAVYDALLARRKEQR